MSQFNNDSTTAITARFFRVDPDATSAYDITPLAVQRLDHAVARRRLIRATRREVLQLREALASGWDIGPELAHEERWLASLERADRCAALGAR